LTAHLQFNCCRTCSVLARRNLSRTWVHFSATGVALSLELRDAETGACDRRHAAGQDCSWSRLTSISDFCKRLSGSYSISCGSRVGVGKFVMAGRVAIHAAPPQISRLPPSVQSLRGGCSVLVDGRVEPGHDGNRILTPPKANATRAKLSSAPFPIGSLDPKAKATSLQLRP
jgi:hypothetical protein